MSDVIISVDLGGTRIRAAQLDQHLKILKRKETLTLAHEGYEPTINRIKSLIQEVMPDDISSVKGIGISAPGPLNPATGVVVHPPNLPGWKDVPLGDILKDAFGVPVYVGNDANVAALAEVAVGAAKGYKHAIYVTISTGIGSGMVINDRLLLGSKGLGAEFGHIPIVVDGERVTTLETEAAGPDMADQARAHIQQGEESLMKELVDGDLDKIDGSTVGKAAQKGDKLALSIVTRSAKLVGLGIVSLLHLFNPEIVIVGGGVSNLGDLLFKPMREAIEKHCIDDDYWNELVLTTPDLGEDVSIYGAATLVITEGGAVQVSSVLEKLSQ